MKFPALAIKKLKNIMLGAMSSYAALPSLRYIRRIAMRTSETLTGLVLRNTNTN
jgi:hypothetical protein